MPSENNGEHADEASTWKEGEQDVFDGEQHGIAEDDPFIDLDDADYPNTGSNPVNGENLEDIENDATPHDVDEPVSELENTAGVPSHDEEAEFYASDDAEAERALDDDSAVGDDNNTAAADVETEERASEEHAEGVLHDSEPFEQRNDVVDDEHGTDAVDAPSPMDVDISQPLDTGITTSDAGFDGSMEVEYPTGDEVAVGSTSGQLVTESVSKEGDQELPMAEDDDSSRQLDRGTTTEVNDLTDSENIASQAAALDGAEYDEVDASQSKTDRPSDLSDISQNVDESGNADSLVEGDDFTVELQPDTSEQEQDSAASEVDQSAMESESTEKTGVELSSGVAEDSDKAFDIRTAAADASTAPASASSETVCISS